MTDNKTAHKQAEDTSEKTDEIKELKTFIKKTAIQNVALKKIIDKLNKDQNHANIPTKDKY